MLKVKSNMNDNNTNYNYVECKINKDNKIVQ